MSIDSETSIKHHHPIIDVKNIEIGVFTIDVFQLSGIDSHPYVADDSVCKTLLRTRKCNVRSFGTSNQLSSSSAGQWKYRTGPDTPPLHLRVLAQCFGGFMWWWIMWHFWREPERVFGAFPTPHPSSWTDAELGIPDDSEDL